MTGATLSYYSMKGQENPQLLAAEGWLTEGKCAICNNEAKFVVEDLPVGPRGFCCEGLLC